MTILVTGSAGHLGEALVRIFRERGDPVRGIDIKASPFTNMVGSISDRAFVKEAMFGVEKVFHTATLHKPHIETHSQTDFVSTNIIGTLNLLQCAVEGCVSAFVQTSTTSAFGDALTPARGEPAAWITEEVMPIPKNIYGATKLAGEHLCRITARNHQLPVIILRTARFFPEADDSKAIRSRYELANVQALELLYRRADIEDVATAHLAAADRAPKLGFGLFVVSATTPFTADDLPLLNADAPAAIQRIFPECRELFENAGWRFFPTIDRVYVNENARRILEWRPCFDFSHVLKCLQEGTDFRSQLSCAVGAKGYHDQRFEDGPYPVGT